MKLIPYHSGHLDRLDNYGCQQWLWGGVDMLKAQRYEDRGPAFTICFDDVIAGAAGLFEITPFRAATWALLSDRPTPQQFVAIHRAVLRFLAEQKYKRIDAHVAVHDKQGHRWARMLGFVMWTYREPWALPDGGTVSVYVRWN